MIITQYCIHQRIVHLSKVLQSLHLRKYSVFFSCEVGSIEGDHNNLFYHSALRINFAGFPTQISLSPTFLVNTEPIPMVA